MLLIVNWLPFKRRKNHGDEHFQNSVESGLLGRGSSDERLPIDEEGYVANEKLVIEETLPTYKFGRNPENPSVTRTSQEKVGDFPYYCLHLEHNVTNASKSDSYKLRTKGPTEPVRVAMKSVSRTSTSDDVTSIGPCNPTSLRIITLKDPINLSNHSSPISPTFYDSDSLKDVTASGIRVIQSTTVKPSQ